MSPPLFSIHIELKTLYIVCCNIISRSFLGAPWIFLCCFHMIWVTFNFGTWLLAIHLKMGNSILEFKFKICTGYRST